MIYETIKVDFQESVCSLQFNRPEDNNTINSQLVAECHHALSQCEKTANVVVLSGSPEVFCFGADFKSISDARTSPAGAVVPSHPEGEGPGPLFDLWFRLATGPYVTISNVRGKANAGGVGFVAASDVVIADETAVFSLSELLFGLYPACVLPFLIRRIGLQKANYLTLMAHPINAPQALEWGLVNAVDKTGGDLVLRRHLQRLRRLSKVAVRRYKTYLNRIHGPLQDLRTPCIAGNLEVFSDIDNLHGITRYVERGLFPWEAA